MSDITEYSPLVICGMHRSGTSLAAGLLSGCGLFLGPEEVLMAPQEDNPLGFFENREIVGIHDGLLGELGGGWDLPPSVDELARASEIEAYKTDALMALSRYKGQAFWGFKDPRASLFMDFWRKLLPDARFLVCLRNPLDVALSMHRRSNSSIANGLALWGAYTRALLSGFDPARDLALSFEALLEDGKAELTRILGALGRQFEDKAVERALEMVRPDMAVTGSSLLAARAHGLSAEDADIYLKFLDLAGPGARKLLEREPLAAHGVGFETTDQGWAWMRRQGHVLVNTSNLKKGLRLEIGFWSNLIRMAPKGCMSISLFLGGEKAAVFPLEREEIKHVEIDLPPTAEDCMKIDLRSNFAASPCMLGLGPDPRFLSIKVGGLKASAIRTHGSSS